MSRFISYLVQRHPFPVTSGEIVAQLQGLFPAAAASFGAARLAADGSPGMAVGIGDHVVVVESVGAPLPSAAFTAAAEADSAWPEAAAALGSGAAYRVIGLRNPAVGHAAALKGAMAVTMVLCALAALGPSVGAVWSQGETVADPRTLTHVAEMLKDGEWPALFWVGLRLGAGLAGDDGVPTVRANTTGLAPFVERELEFLPAPLDRTALELLLRFLCATLIRDGHVLRDRQTYVLSETETLRAIYGRSGAARDTKVIKLSYLREVPTAQPAPVKAAAAGRRPVFGRRGGR